MRFCDIKFFDPHDLSLSTSTNQATRGQIAWVPQALLTGDARLEFLGARGPVGYQPTKALLLRRELET